MKSTLNVFLFSLLLLIWSNFSNARPMTEAERIQLKSQLDSILKTNQDECYVNMSNINSIEVLSQPPKNKKSFIEKKTKNVYVSGRLTSTLNLNLAEIMLPEGSISTDSQNSFSISYTRPVDLDVVEIAYGSIQTQNFSQGAVVHYFELNNGQPIWKYSTMDLQDGNDKKPQVRCKSKGDSGFDSAKAAAMPSKTGSFIFMDLELLAAEEYCLMQCTEPDSRSLLFSQPTLKKINNR